MLGVRNRVITSALLLMWLIVTLAAVAVIAKFIGEVVIMVDLVV
jgi:hypothetical protein